MGQLLGIVKFINSVKFIRFVKLIRADGQQSLWRSMQVRKSLTLAMPGSKLLTERQKHQCRPCS